LTSKSGLRDLIKYYSELDVKSPKQSKGKESEEKSDDPDEEKTDEEDDGEEIEEADEIQEPEQEKDRKTAGMSIHISQEVFIPRLFSQKSMGNIPVNIVTPKQIHPAPPPDDFLEFNITDVVVKVQGREDGILGKVSFSFFLF